MKILICDNIEKLGEDFIDLSMSMLPTWRKEKMLKIKHLRGKVQCAIGYFLVNIACCDNVCNISRGCNKWIYNEHGKPYFEGKKDLFFSLSHCKSAVAVAVDEEEVGVDIEEISRYKESLAKYVLSEEEYKDYESAILTEQEKKEKFIEIWTKKEAVFKLLGTGITHEIKDVLKRSDVNVCSQKVGNRYLSVATRKIVDITKAISVLDVKELMVRYL